MPPGQGAGSKAVLPWVVARSRPDGRSAGVAIGPPQSGLMLFSFITLPHMSKSPCTRAR